MTAEDFISKKNKDFVKNPIIKVKDIGRKGNRYFFREAWTFMLQSDSNEKAFMIERLRKKNYEGRLARKI